MIQKNLYKFRMLILIIYLFQNTKPNSKYLIGCLEKFIKSLVLILPKKRGYVKTFRAKDGDKDKNNKLMSFHTDHQKLFEKSKSTWTKIEDLKNIELNVLPVYGDRYIKTKIRTYGDNVYTDFHDLNVSEDIIEWKSFTVISIDSLVVYKNKYYPRIYLDYCTDRIANKQMTDCLNDNLFETD